MTDRLVVVDDPDGHGATVLPAAPTSDSGQKALAVRIISSLGVGGNVTPLGHFGVSVTTSATSLPSLPPLATIRRVVIRTVDQPVNWTDDGVNPTSTTGMYLAAGDTLVYDGSRADQLKLIRATSATGNADVRVAYYGI